MRLAFGQQRLGNHLRFDMASNQKQLNKVQERTKINSLRFIIVYPTAFKFPSPENLDFAPITRK